MALHDESFVFVFEADGLCPHLIEIFGFQVFLIYVLFHVHLIILLQEYWLNSQKNN